jgi:glucosyl-dolichyl phosphate glucuronosyltransferase
LLLISAGGKLGESIMAVRLSVIVCTYNRADLLGEALESLARQTADPSTYEILVVDNNSTDRTLQLSRDFIASHATCRVMTEFAQGLSHARNRGYREACAPWVAYMDDDAKAYPDFVERILYIIDQYPFDAVGGMFLPWYKYGKPKWFRDTYASNGRLLDQVGVLEKSYISGGVSAFKKSVLETCGGFPTDMGMTGCTIAYGEETLLQTRMRQKGYSIGFDPQLRIEHVVNTYKLSLWWLVKAEYYHGLAFWAAYGEMVSWRRIIKRAFELLIFPCTKSRIFTPRLWCESDYYIQNWAFDMAQPLAENLGIITSGIKELLGRTRPVKPQ